MIEAIIFDMDGVIIDSQPAHYEIEMKMLKELGINPQMEELQSFAGTTCSFMWETLKQRYNLIETVEQLVNRKKQRFEETLLADGIIPLVDGVKGFIKELSDNNFKLAIASSSPSYVIKIVVDKFGLKDYFNELVSGENVKKGKPEPDIFLLAAEKLGVNPKKCLVIEDAYAGVTAAKKACMKCIGFRNPNSGNQDLSKADKIIDKFEKINSGELKNL